METKVEMELKDRDIERKNGKKQKMWSGKEENAQREEIQTNSSFNSYKNP